MSNLLRPCALRGAPFQQRAGGPTLHAAPTNSTSSTAPNPVAAPTQVQLVAPCPSPPAPAGATTLQGGAHHASSQQPLRPLVAHAVAAQSHSLHAHQQLQQQQPLQQQPAGTAGSGATHRRDVLLLSSSLVLSHLAQLAGMHAPRPAHAADAPSASTSGRGLAKYIRKRKLDPLETYVPLVLEARNVLPSYADLAVSDPGAARDALRQGPFNGLRDNIRAIGEYAAEGQLGRDGAAPLVTGFFKALEGYDQLLFVAIRDKQAPSREDADARVRDVDAAFAALLATVPEAIVLRAREVLDVAQAKSKAAEAAGAAPAEAFDDRALLELLP